MFMHCVYVHAYAHVKLFSILLVQDTNGSYHDGIQPITFTTTNRRGDVFSIRTKWICGATDLPH